MPYAPSHVDPGAPRRRGWTPGQLDGGDLRLCLAGLVLIAALLLQALG
jgi:hypothetical protein